MRPTLVLDHSFVDLDGKPVEDTSIDGLPGYEAASQGGGFYVTAVAMRHRIRYAWATCPPGTANSEIYRSCEFMAMDEEPVCFPTFVLHRRDELDHLVRRKFDRPEIQAEVFDAVRQFARDALRYGWQSSLVEVEVKTVTLLSYDQAPSWCLEPCKERSGHPIETLEMEVYAGEEGAEGCAVCLEDFTPGAEVERLPCHHRFHAECVLRWLHNVGYCPLCRAEFRIK